MIKPPAHLTDAWSPSQHLDRAELLIRDVEASVVQGARYVMTPVALTLAQTHIELARAKREIRR